MKLSVKLRTWEKQKTIIYMAQIRSQSLHNGYSTKVLYVVFLTSNFRLRCCGANTSIIRLCKRWPAPIYAYHTNMQGGDIDSCSSLRILPFLIRCSAEYWLHNVNGHHITFATDGLKHFLLLSFNVSILPQKTSKIRGILAVLHALLASKNVLHIIHSSSDIPWSCWKNYVYMAAEVQPTPVFIDSMR